MRPLRFAAVIEAATLVILLVNLVTVHARPITALGGPVHGTAYLAVIALVFLLPAAPRSARWLSLIPGVGGVLALRRMNAP